MSGWFHRWRQRLGGSAQGADVAQASRWVVLDVETSGLDPARDRLLAIAEQDAPGLRVRIVLDDSTEA